MGMWLLSWAAATAIAQASPATAWELGCVDSQVTLTLSIYDRDRLDRPIFSDQARFDTDCSAGIGPGDARLLGLVLDDMCQLLGVEASACADVIRDDLGEIPALASQGRLRTLAVKPFEDDERYAELSLGFAGQDGDVLPAALEADGSFETTAALPVMEPRRGEVLQCTATADLSARGQLSAVRSATRVEVGRSRTFLCRTGAADLMMKLEIRTVQRAGDVADDVALR